ncbi:hypothetical protein F4X88_17390 [Candidatus Poribacteria bacterium]|nr:hypothetical protein [Candidatus Poribacteria bacterium]MYA58059.1 hypothetical protein [Candidatus Poribacteria bacterium]
MKKMRTWKECLIEDLADREEAIHYLQAILDDYYSFGQTLIVREALKTVIEAQGGISKLTQHTDISPQTLETALSNTDTPLIDAIGVVLNALGYQLLIQPIVDEDANLELATGEPKVAKATAHLSEDSGTSHRVTN